MVKKSNQPTQKMKSVLDRSQLKKQFLDLHQWLLTLDPDISGQEILNSEKYAELVKRSTPERVALYKGRELRYLKCYLFKVFLPCWLFPAKMASNYGYNSMTLEGHRIWTARNNAYKKQCAEFATLEAQELEALDAQVDEGKLTDAGECRKLQKAISAKYKQAQEDAHAEMRDFPPFSVQAYKACVTMAATRFASSTNSRNRTSAKKAQMSDIPAIWKEIVELPENAEMVEKLGLTEDFS